MKKSYIKNLQKGSTETTIFVIVVILIAVGLYAYLTHPPKPGEQVDVNTTTTGSTTTENTATGTDTGGQVATASSTCGIKVISLKLNAQVRFPLTVKGIVDNTFAATNGCSWQMFEGQAGSAELYYNLSNQGWKPANAAAPVTVDDWMSKSTSFSVTLNFDNSALKLPSGTLMKIVFSEEDASGRGSPSTVEFPITLK